MSVTCVFGMQWGDEGKGRIVDLLAAKSEFVVRYQGGANAGHTVIVGQEKYVLHLLPSGVIQPDTTNIVGNGVVVDPATLIAEIDGLAKRGIDLQGRLFVSDRAHVVLPYHKTMDMALEALRGSDALGTTSRGIGPAYGDKFRRAGMRVVDMLKPERYEELLRANTGAWNAILEQAGMPAIDIPAVIEEMRAVGERVRPYVADTTDMLLSAWRAGRSILAEGAQGFGLDVDHGSYPFVTSSTTGPAGVSAGTGLPPKALTRVVGIAKAYLTRVGAGPFPSCDHGAAGRHLAEKGHEFGATTGRPRDCGWFDAVLARRAALTQGCDAVALMKVDCLSGLDEIKLCTAYELDGRRLDSPPAWAGDWVRCTPVYETFEGWSEDLGGARHFDDLPVAAQVYVRAVQAIMETPIEMISVGAERERFIPLERGVPVAV
ncbi:MAG: adenylosuccinate synthase [Planctomycetota bacterium]|nr:adenylosuccinate synthase [Planctomycetota bacterium]